MHSLRWDGAFSKTLRPGSISPRLVPDIEILPWRRSHVVALQVHPSPTRPHHLAKEGADRGTYVRVGSTNRRADAELIQELRRLVRGESFDEQPMPDADSEALDFRAASESFAAVRTLHRRDLATLRLTTDHQGRQVPTVGGLLLFGRERERWFPDAWIQAGRFKGTDKSTILDHVELRSLPIRAIDVAIAFVEKHAHHGAEIGPVRRKERWSVPPVAIREAVINAVAHADYAQRGAPICIAIFDDRIEIENPGLLPFGLTVEDLTLGVSKLRNRVIGRVFHAVGLIEQWGSGVQRMVAACRETGLAPPRFEEVAIRFQPDCRRDWPNAARHTHTSRTACGTRTGAGDRHRSSGPATALLPGPVTCAQVTVHLYDKFHVLLHLNEAMDQVRKAEYKRLTNRPDRTYIKGQKYVLLSHLDVPIAPTAYTCPRRILLSRARHLPCSLSLSLLRL